MNNKQTYIIRLEAENGKAVTGWLKQVGDDGEASFKKLGDGASSAEGKVSILSDSVMRKMIPALSATALGAAVRNAVKDLGDLHDAAERISVTAEQLQVLRFAGDDVGMTMSSVDQSLEEFTKRIGQAREGTGKLVDIIHDYNIQLKDKNGQNRSAMDILADMAQILNETADAEERLRIASATGLGQFTEALKTGVEGMTEYERKARELGLVIDNELVTAADNFDTQWSRVLLIWETNFKAKIAGIIQGLQRLNGTSLEEVDGRIAQIERRLQSTSALSNNPVERFFLQGELSQLQKRRHKMEPAAEQSPMGPPVTLYNRAVGEAMPSWKRNAAGGGGDMYGPDASLFIKHQVDNRKKAADAAQQHADKLAGVVEQLQFENDQLARSEREQEIYNALKQAGVDRLSQQGQEIERLVGLNYDLAKSQEAELKAMEALNDRAEEFGDIMGDAADRAIGDFEDLGDVLDDVLQDIYKMFIRETISNPIRDFAGDLFKNMFSNFGGFKAEGGPLQQGKWYVAGEHGPEPIWGGGPGSFATGYGSPGGGQSVKVNVYNQTTREVDAKVVSGNGGRDIDVVLVEKMNSAIKSGAMDSAMRQRYGANPQTVGRG